MNDNSKIISASVTLAHLKAFEENIEELADNEENMYLIDDDQDYGKYTDYIQVEFDKWYDYYYSILEKSFNNE